MTIQSLIAQHMEAIQLLNGIENAEFAIETSTPYLSDNRKHLSYYEAVKEGHERIINENTNKRHDLAHQYDGLRKQMQVSGLPSFSDHDCTLPF